MAVALGDDRLVHSPVTDYVLQDTKRRILVVIARTPPEVCSSSYGLVDLVERLERLALLTDQSFADSSYYLSCDDMRVDHYQELMDRGWRRYGLCTSWLSMSLSADSETDQAPYIINLTSRTNVVLIIQFGILRKLLLTGLRLTRLD